MNPEIVLNMLQDIFFQSLVNVVPLALFENVEFISLSTKRVLQRNAFSIWVVLHFKASQIFYFPFLQQLLQKYDKIITNTIAVLFSSSLNRKQKRVVPQAFTFKVARCFFRMHNPFVLVLLLTNSIFLKERQKNTSLLICRSTQRCMHCSLWTHNMFLSFPIFTISNSRRRMDLKLLMLPETQLGRGRRSALPEKERNNEQFLAQICVSWPQKCQVRKRCPAT